VLSFLKFYYVVHMWKVLRCCRASKFWYCCWFVALLCG
jgi:hypothetical protein